MSPPSDKPKVAFFLLRQSEESDQITGGTWSNLALIESLDRHEALVVVNSEDLLVKELEARGIRYVVLPEELSWRGARRSLRSFATKLKKAALFNAKVRALCAAEHVRVFQCDENAATFVSLGAKLAGARLVVAYRNYPGVVPRMKPIYKAPMLLADRMVATSELLREVIVNQGWRKPKERTTRIYNGIDVRKVRATLAGKDRIGERQKLGIGEREVAVGVVGSIVPFKRQVELIEEVIAPSASELRSAGARFHFLGGIKDKVYSDRCRALVSEHNLHDLVSWAGYVTDMPSWFVALDLVAFPAPEGTARTLLECAAYGVPSVARKTSKEAVIDGENGFLCEEISDLRAPLLRLVADPDLRVQMGIKGQTLAEERFDVDKNRSMYASIYDALIG